MGLKDRVRIDRAVPPEEAQRSRATRFWDAVAGSCLHKWTTGMNPCDAATRILIGLAPPYSDLDIDLAETMMFEAPKHPEIHVDVFDVSGLDSADLQQYIPRLGRIYHTPIVGLWKNVKSFNGPMGFAARISL